MVHNRAEARTQMCGDVVRMSTLCAMPSNKLADLLAGRKLLAWAVTTQTRAPYDMLESMDRVVTTDRNVDANLPVILLKS